MNFHQKPWENFANMMSCDAVRNWGLRIHDIIESKEMAVNICLDRIADHKQSGFSPETHIAIQLHNDARTLRKLADRMDATRDLLIGETTA